jgi:hypothetical protein
VSADLNAGAASVSWIDIFSTGPITLTETDPPFAVHANNTSTNATAGTITIVSKQATVDLFGVAVQANAPGGGGAGGTVAVEAAQTVNFHSAIVEAKGANSGGGHQSGGTISARSFNGQVLGVAPGQLNADGGKGQGTVDLGAVELQGCDSGGPALSYTGTATPVLTPLGPACGGTPTLPSFVDLPTCKCAAPTCPPTS